MREFLRNLLPRQDGETLSDLPTLRERIVQVFAAYSVMIATPLILIVVYRSLTVRWDWATNLQIAAYVILVASLIFNKRLGTSRTAACIIITPMAAALSGLATWGHFAAGAILLVGFAVITAVLLGTRWSLIFTAAATLATLLISEGFQSGFLQYNFDESQYLATRSPWIVKSLHIAMVGALAGFVVSWMAGSLQKTISTLQKRETELERSNELLTQQAVQLEEQASLLEDQTVSLTAERDRAQSASRAKDQFLSVVSHELRTPLNPVVGFLGLLQRESELDDESRKQVQLMQQSSEHLLKLIDQIVDFSELDRGELSLKPHPTRLEELKTETVFRLANEAKLNQLNFQIECQNPAELDLSIDKKRVLQAIAAVGENAIKFTPEGSIKISLKLSGATQESKGTLSITVTDTGVGIPEEKLSQIFDPFIQAEADRTRSTGGVGLGLSFCQQVVEAMDGTLTLKSKLGEGTEVRMRIPVDTQSARKEAAQPPKRRKLRFSTPLEILVVEDNYTNQKVVASLLKRMGTKTTCAANGKIALEILEDQRFDAILMDLSMPVMDGITSTREIRNDPRIADIPIIALTAHSYSSCEEECMEAGMDGFLTKPVNNSKLFEALSQVRQSCQSLPNGF